MSNKKEASTQSPESKLNDDKFAALWADYEASKKSNNITATMEDTNKTETNEDTLKGDEEEINTQNSNAYDENNENKCNVTNEEEKRASRESRNENRYEDDNSRINRKNDFQGQETRNYNDSSRGFNSSDRMHEQSSGNRYSPRRRGEDRNNRGWQERGRDNWVERNQSGRYDRESNDNYSNHGYQRRNNFNDQMNNWDEGRGMRGNNRRDYNQERQYNDPSNNRYYQRNDNEPRLRSNDYNDSNEIGPQSRNIDNYRRGAPYNGDNSRYERYPNTNHDSRRRYHDNDNVRYDNYTENNFQRNNYSNRTDEQENYSGSKRFRSNNNYNDNGSYPNDSCNDGSYRAPRRNFSEGGYSQRPKRTTPIDPAPSRVLGLFGLSVNSTVEDLRSFVNEHVPNIQYEDLHLVTHKGTGESRGFAFIYFSSLEESMTAKEKLYGKYLDDREIRVDFSISDAPRPTMTKND